MGHPESLVAQGCATRLMGVPPGIAANEGKCKTDARRVLRWSGEVLNASCTYSCADVLTR
jgi:hypothetical protein